jgi:hypothetical protein
VALILLGIAVFFFIRRRRHLVVGASQPTESLKKEVNRSSLPMFSSSELAGNGIPQKLHSAELQTLPIIMPHRQAVVSEKHEIGGEWRSLELPA